LGDYPGIKHLRFPLTIAVFGQKVHNIHPSGSGHIDNQIVDAFRNGSKNEAYFRINSKGECVYILYIALRSSSGDYNRTFDVIEDVTVNMVS
jgi:hypothetical protein